MIREKESLVEGLVDEYYEMLERNRVTESELIQYRQDLPLLGTIKSLREEVEELKMSRASVQLDMAELVRSSIAKKAPKGMNTSEVNKAVQLLLDNAPYLEKEIKSILNKEWSLPNA